MNDRGSDGLLHADASARRLLAPDGYAIIPVLPASTGPLRICVIVRREPEPIGGHLVQLRDTFDGRIILGCLTDAAGTIHQWLELWLQDVDQLGDTVLAREELLTNDLIDRRWRQHYHALIASEPASVLATGWEVEPLDPVVLDLASGESRHPVESASGVRWRLCRDDALLMKKGLHPYGRSLHRYLYVQEQGEESPFVSITRAAGENEDADGLESVIRPDASTVSLTLGGLMLVRPHWPLSYEQFIDLLSGMPAPRLLHGRIPLSLSEDDSTLSDASAKPLVGEDRLFLGRHGRAGRFIEILHLKLRALYDAIQAMRQAAAALQRPHLDLTADSFRVSVAGGLSSLPLLWTARVRLVDPGAAVPVGIGTEQGDYHLRGTNRISVYQPQSATLPVRGFASVRISKLIPDRGETTIVEAAFSTHEPLHLARHDLVAVRLNVAGERLDLYGSLTVGSGRAPDEWQFRSVGARFPRQTLSRLQEAQSIPLRDVPFQVIANLSTPYDMYGLGVLATRSLLVDEETTLGVAVDHMLSLASRAGQEDASVGLPLRLRGVFDGDPRWLELLGPQHLLREALSAEEAFDLVPPEVWFDVLALILRMFPGQGPDSICTDFGDAEAGAVHRVFDQTLSDLTSLLTRTKSLLIIDWQLNREIHAVIRRCSVGLDAEPATRS